MKRYLFAMFVAVSAAVVFAACGSKSEAEAELKAVVLKNMEATQNEDIEGALKTLDVPQAQLDLNRQVMEELFELYDLEYRLVSFKVVKCEGDTAVVEVVQETKKVSGPAFQDNLTTTEQQMKKGPDGWKIVGTKIKEMKAL